MFNHIRACIIFLFEQQSDSAVSKSILVFIGKTVENYYNTVIGTNEEDHDVDQQGNKDSELKTAVPHQESNLAANKIPSSTELHSNGHEYVLVNRSTSQENTLLDTESNKNENSPINES